MTVPIIGDTLIEPNETFFVNLSTPTNATISKAQGIGTITNDDFPKVSINDVQMREGNSGRRAMYFTISLDDPSPVDAVVSYTTQGSPVRSATAGSDYTTKTGSVIIPAGQLTKPIYVYVYGDTAIETDEMFQVKLTYRHQRDYG